MKEILKLLKDYFNSVKLLFENEILTESEIFDSLSKINSKIDSDLKKISETNEDKITFKKTILDTIKMMQQARAWYDTKLGDDKTKKTVYQFYKICLLPKFTNFWKLCSEYNNKHGFNENQGLQSIKVLIDAMNKGTIEQLNLKSVKTYFNY